MVFVGFITKSITKFYKEITTMKVYDNDTRQVNYITIYEKSSVVLEHIEVAVEGELTFGEEIGRAHV